MPCPDWPDPHRSTTDARRALFRARRYAYRRITSEYPARRCIEVWHGLLFDGDPPLDYYAGNVRQRDPRRTCLAQNVGVGSLPGTHFSEVPNEIDRLAEEMGRELHLLEHPWDDHHERARSSRLAVAIGRAVGRFVKIHPFINGNGRTSRLLWEVLLARFQVGPQATVLSRPMRPYGDLMMDAMRGNNAPFIAHVLIGLADASPTKPQD
jgi:hypothetical protein